MATYNRKDHLYRQAKSEGYRSRAAYKLLELDRKLRLFRSGMRVLDLGSYPGGWLQVALEKVGPQGLVVGADLRALEPFDDRRLHLLEGDLSATEMHSRVERIAERFDVVMSDMAPALSGIPARDNAHMAELLALAFALAERFLKQGGDFIAKAFPSPDVDEVYGVHRKSFAKLERSNLKSSRATSNELYIIGRGYREG